MASWSAAGSVPLSSVPASASRAARRSALVAAFSFLARSRWSFPNVVRWLPMGTLCLLRVSRPRSKNDNLRRTRPAQRRSECAYKDSENGRVGRIMGDQAVLGACGHPPCLLGLDAADPVERGDEPHM